MERKAVEEVAETLKILAHPVRLQIIALLSSKEESVGHIAISVKQRQSFISHQLSIMKRSKLLKRMCYGNKIYYSIHDYQMKQFLNCLMSQYVNRVNDTSHKTTTDTYIP